MAKKEGIAIFQQVQVRLVQGYQVASGQSETDRRFPEGTIKLQIPHFKNLGLDLDEYFGMDYVCGTLNFSVGEQNIEIVKPEYFFQNVEWTNIFPPENFYLSKAKVIFKDKSYSALLYIPDPATKVDHFSVTSTIEVIAQRISDIGYGDTLTLCYNPLAIRIQG